MFVFRTDRRAVRCAASSPFIIPHDCPSLRDQPCCSHFHLEHERKSEPVSMITSIANDSLRPRRLPAMKFQLPSIWVASVALLALPSAVLAATPVDIFQDMESGQEGDLLTPAIMNASSHGGRSKWSINGRMWVSTRNASNLPGPVTVEGVSYSGAAAPAPGCSTTTIN